MPKVPRSREFYFKSDNHQFFFQNVHLIKEIKHSRICNMYNPENEIYILEIKYDNEWRVIEFDSYEERRDVIDILRNFL